MNWTPLPKDKYEQLKDSSGRFTHRFKLRPKQVQRSASLYPYVWMIFAFILTVLLLSQCDMALREYEYTLPK